VYAFALCAYYILHGKPLHTRADPRASDNNTKRNEQGYDWELMRTTINECLQDDPDARLKFEELQKEIFYYYIA